MSCSPSSALSSRASSPCSSSPPPAELLESLNTLIATSLSIPAQIHPRGTHRADEDEEGDGQCDDGAGGRRPMTKAEKQNAKKKRRKERERTAKEAEVAEASHALEGQGRLMFRLFSSCPVREVKVDTVQEDYPLPQNPRLLPVSPAQRSLLHRRALDSAVEYPDLGGPSGSWATSDQDPLPTYTLSTDSHSSPSTVLLARLAGIDHHPRPPRSKDLIPLVDLVRPSIPAERPKRNRARKRSKRGSSPSIIAPPRYFRPPRALGGKSRSAVWAYGVGIVQCPPKGHHTHL